MAGPTPVSTRQVESVVLPGKELFGNKNPGLISSTRFPSTGGEARVTIRRALALENKGSVDSRAKGRLSHLRAGLLPFLAESRPVEQKSIMRAQPGRGAPCPSPMQASAQVGKEPSEPLYRD